MGKLPKLSWVILRRLASALLFLASGLYSLSFLAMASVNMTYRTIPDDIHWIGTITYMAPMLLFPFVIVSLIPRRFATVGLWVVTLIIIANHLFLTADIRLKLAYATESRSLLGLFMETLPLIALPVATQFAVELRKLNAREEERESFDTEV